MPAVTTMMALLRGLHLAAMLSALGTVGFVAWMLPAAAPVADPLRNRLRRLGGLSLLVGLLAGAGWFMLQAAAIADAQTPSDGLGALPVVALHTRYGTILMLRLGLLVLATALLAGSRQVPGRVTLPLTFAVIAVALVLEGLIGHAGATGGAVGDGLVVSESLHLLAAGLWLGALPPLWLSLRALSPQPAALVCERFSPIGLACVLLLAGTGFAQGLQLIGGLPALVGTPYGRIALLKIVLFLLALALATINRLWLTDRLVDGAVRARRHLLTSVCIETAIGLAIVLAAAFMASSPPAVHTPPVWPFSWRFSLVTVNEDADFRREVVVSLLAILGAASLLVLALAWRRLRLVALCLLALAVVLRGNSLRLLTVEAYPTSFQVSPTGFSAASIVRGQAVFVRACAACHGLDGDGRGPAAASLHIRPADLTMPHIWEHSDGEMFWWVSHGMDDPEGGRAMPGFAATLSEGDRWAVIDYVRAHNEGVSMRPAAGMRLDRAVWDEFAVPVRAPAVPVTCAGRAASTMADLRGNVVHVVAGAAARYDVPAQLGMSTVDLALRDGVTPMEGACVVADPAAWAAYAVLAGLPSDRLAGTEYLIDPNGWLRAVRRPEGRGDESPEGRGDESPSGRPEENPGGRPESHLDALGGWATRDDLIAEIRTICATPIQPPGGGPHEHHH